MKKFLYVVEYAKGLNIPDLKFNEHETQFGNSTIRSSVEEGYTKKDIKESINTYYNNSKVEETVIPLDDVLVYDNIDADIDKQEIAYVFECPICSSVTITSEHDIDFCPQCENTEFPFNLLALIPVQQMEEIGIDNKDVSTLVLVKDDNVVMVDLPE